METVIQAPEIVSGNKTADALIRTGPGVLKSVIVNTDGTNDATLVLYDNTEASGKVVWEGSCLGPNKTGIDHCNRKFENGLYGDLTVAGGGTAKWNVSDLPG